MDDTVIVCGGASHDGKNFQKLYLYVHLSTLIIDIALFLLELF